MAIDRSSEIWGDSVVTAEAAWSTSEISPEIAWAAGLYEGEGTAMIRPSGSVTMAIQMRDREPIERFWRIVGRGYLDSPYEGWSYWRWRVQYAPHAREIIEKFWPFLSPRRQKQAQPILDRASDLDARVCRCGCGRSLKGRRSYTKWATPKCAAKEKSKAS